MRIAIMSKYRRVRDCRSSSADSLIDVMLTTGSASALTSVAVSIRTVTVHFVHLLSLAPSL